MRISTWFYLFLLIGRLAPADGFAQVTLTNLWHFTASDDVSPPALGADGTVYVAAGGLLYALGPDGKERWHAAVTPFSPPNPEVAVGLDGTLYALAPPLVAFHADGTQAWTAGGSDVPVTSSWLATALDGTMYVGVLAGPGQIYYGVRAIHPDGSTQWESDTTRMGSVLACAVGKDGTVYASASDNTVFALDALGHERWRYQTGAKPSAPVLAADGTVLAGSADGTLYALNSDSTKRWVFKLLDFIGTPCVGQTGVIYVTGYEFLASSFMLYALNPDGTAKWSFAMANVQVTGEQMISNPAVGADPTRPDQDGAVYVLAGQGSLSATLYAISPDGAELGEWSTNDASASAADPVIDAQGVVYVGLGRTLYAIKGVSGPAKGAWPMYGRDLRHTSAVVPFEPLPGFVQEQSLGTNGVALTLVGQAGRPYSLEASADLRAWAALTNGASANGAVWFTDSASNLTHRFYRAVSQP